MCGWFIFYICFIVVFSCLYIVWVLVSFCWFVSATPRALMVRMDSVESRPAAASASVSVLCR